MSLAFRNLNITPDAPVEEWGFEGLLTAIERGDRTHWQRIAAALETEPRGKVAAELAEVLDAVENPAMAELFRGVHQAALARAEARQRAEVVDRLQTFLSRSGLSRAEFAARLGTSPSRLSTYLTGRVVPSALVLVRAEELADRAKT